MMIGVPKPAKNKNAVDNVVSIDPTMATSDLNQRLRSKIKKNAVRTAIIIDGSFMA